jgi:hypothetical protein
LACEIYLAVLDVPLLPFIINPDTLRYGSGLGGSVMGTPLQEQNEVGYREPEGEETNGQPHSSNPFICVKKFPEIVPVKRGILPRGRDGRQITKKLYEVIVIGYI